MQPAQPSVAGDSRYPVALRMRTTTSSAIRDLLKHAARPGMTSLAGGLPASELFDVDALRTAAEESLRDEPRSALQYGLTEGQPVLRDQLGALMASCGAPT